ncbi:uncharacterized protein BX664DRAFT_370034, partial [Halteromyces radiatus]|uniref:uncharacterized protein n=1 Tax=Halteromyces radiatus TaxID=101107 RepID=UPI00221F44FD
MTQDDLDTLKGCATFTGTITIDGSASEELALVGIQELKGNLILAGNPALRTFQAPQLTKVKGELRITNQTVLGKLQLPSLIETKSLTLSVLPALEHMDFPAGLVSVDDAHLQDTRVPTVTGFKPEKMHSFALLSNNYLKTFDFSSVKELTGSMNVASNGNSLDFQANQLTSIEAGDFRNLAQLSMPKLTRVAGDITFHDNEFTSLQLDQIDMVKGTLTIANNNKLTQTSFQHLIRVGGAFSIGNNTQLSSVEGFPSLNEVDGTIDIAGNIDTYALPVLQDVRGGMRLQTTSGKLQCQELERKMKGENVVKGNTWSCGSGMQESQMQPTLGQDPNAG